MRRPTARGLTLLELLLAVSLLSLLSLLSWRTLDTMTRTERWSLERSQHWLTWQTAMAQWQADLDAADDVLPQPTPEFDGLSLQWVRRAPAALAGESPAWTVVAWGLQNDDVGERRWARWSSPPLINRDELEQAWAAGRAWARSPTPSLRTGQTLMPATQGWQLYYHRGGAWTNPLSSDRQRHPEAIRVELRLPGTQDPAPVLRKDWVHPSHSPERSG